MVVTLHFDPEALLACRFAISPLSETVGAIRLLASASGRGYQAAWLRAVEPVLDTLDLTPLALLVPRYGYGPDFLNPAPGTPSTTFTTELETLRATPATRVGREIDRCLHERFGHSLPPSARALTGKGETARGLCADTLEAAWHSLVEPWWPRIRQTLEGDIAYRSRQFADSGLTATLRELHPQLAWTGHALRVEVRSHEQVAVGAEGIVLVPTAFGSLGVTYEPASINYQTRGIASIWTSPSKSPVVLARLLGARRATILINLDEPASTTGLADRCHLPLSSISEHLTVLREAGLISTHRTGRCLRHTRTPLGTELACQQAALDGP